MANAPGPQEVRQEEKGESLKVAFGAARFL